MCYILPQQYLPLKMVTAPTKKVNNFKKRAEKKDHKKHEELKLCPCCNFIFFVVYLMALSQ
jgi:hypothetical protein